MYRALSLFMLSMAGVFGLLVVPAVHGGLLVVLIALGYAGVAYCLLGDESRKRLAVLAIANRLIGGALYLTPRSDTGSVGSLGGFVVIACVLIEAPALWKSYRSELVRWA